MKQHKRSAAVWILSRIPISPAMRSHAPQYPVIFSSHRILIQPAAVGAALLTWWGALLVFKRGWVSMATLTVPGFYEL